MEEVNFLFPSEDYLIDINYSGSKKIKITLKKVVPNVEISLYLVARDHGVEMELSQDVWNAIVTKSEEIKNALRHEREEVILERDDLEVFTERMHDSCAVCFENNEDVRINIMLKTFKNMMKSIYDIQSKYTKINSRIKEQANSLGRFLDANLAKISECNGNMVMFTAYINNMKTQVDSLKRRRNDSNLNVANLEDGFDSSSDDDGYNRSYRRKRSRW